MRTTHPVPLNIGNVTWSNMPAALTEFLNATHRRAKLQLIDVDNIRLVVRVSTAGLAGAILFAQYSTDETVWNTLTASIDLGTPTGTKVSTWAPIPSGAKGDVFVRLVGQDGNGTADPIIGNVYLEYL